MGVNLMQHLLALDILQSSSNFNPFSPALNYNEFPNSGWEHFAGFPYSDSNRLREYAYNNRSGGQSIFVRSCQYLVGSHPRLGNIYREIPGCQEAKDKALNNLLNANNKKKRFLDADNDGYHAKGSSSKLQNQSPGDDWKEGVSQGEDCDDAYYSDTNICDYEIKMYYNDKNFLKDDIAYIDVTPSMPNLKIELKRKQTVNTLATPIKVTATLDINFSRRSAFDEQISIPITNYNTKTSIVFPNFNGGKATLRIKAGNVAEKTFVFHIRGKNPTEQQVTTYLSTLAGGDIWFMPKIIDQESSFHQFNIGVASANDITIATPNKGAPDGWGLGQLDPSVGGVILTSNLLWNWKNNLLYAVNFINGAKRNESLAQLNAFQAEIDTWNAARSDDPFDADDALDITTEGNYTFSHKIGSKTVVGWADFDITGDYSYIDANWIRRYNGGSYIRFDENSFGNPMITQDDIKVAPRISNTNSSGHNYVEAVCNH